MVNCPEVWMNVWMIMYPDLLGLASDTLCLWAAWAVENENKWMKVWSSKDTVTAILYSFNIKWNGQQTHKKKKQWANQDQITS